MHALFFCTVLLLEQEQTVLALLRPSFTGVGCCKDIRQSKQNLTHASQSSGKASVTSSSSGGDVLSGHGDCRL